MRRLCFYTRLSVILFTGGSAHGGRGACSGGCLLWGGAWSQGGVCSGGCLLWGLVLSGPGGVSGPGGGLVLGGSGPGGVPGPGGPGGDPPGTATAAGGTHPTGMHSCYCKVLLTCRILYPLCAKSLFAACRM